MEHPLAATTRAVSDRDLLSLFRGERSAAEVAVAAGITENDILGARREYLARRLPATEATLKAATNGTVEILRDRAWVPHVFAGSTADLWFGVGFAMAQDRLWQMDRFRRRA
jgi:penicillin amidase